MKLTIEQKIFITIIFLAGFISSYFMFFNKTESNKDLQTTNVAQTSNNKNIHSGSYGKNFSPTEIREELNQVETDLYSYKEQLKSLDLRLEEENQLIEDIKIELKQKSTINIFNNNNWYDIFSIYQTYNKKESDIEFLKTSLEEKEKDNKEKMKQRNEINEKIKLLDSKEKQLKEYLTKILKIDSSVDFSVIDSKIEMENIDRIKKDKIDNFMKDNKIDMSSIIDNNKTYSLSTKGMVVANLPPFIMPTHGTITSDFGYRTHPIFKTQKFHSGTDIGVDYNTPIKASNYGLVVYSGWYGGFGNTVILSHDDGVYTLYGHNSEVKVQEGEMVKQGQVIALAGSTGYSTGPHCHFSMWINNALVDPMEHVND